jgi:cytochrome c-type biogenesis protein CcmH
MLVLALIMAGVYLRGRSNTKAEEDAVQALSEQEKAQLDRILKD